MVDTGPNKEIEQALEDSRKLAEQMLEIQEDLRHSHEEVEAKSGSIEILKNRLEKAQAEVKMLTQEKEHTQHRMEGEKQALSEEMKD